MKKSILALSACAVLASSSYAGGDLTLELQEQLKALKAQVEMLEKKLNAQAAQQQTPKVDEARIEKIEKKLARVDKTAKVAKIQSSGDNIKWDVDFRTQVDNIQYKLGSGHKIKNSALYTNRLWLGMGYAPNDNTIFKGKLSYNKVYGDNRAQIDNTSTGNYAGFDWVTNEAASNDNTLKIKEAYWLYKNDTLAGADIPWTISIGRRPSTDGMPINLRNDQPANSPLSHTVDVEFDGFSAKFDTEKLIGIKGSWFKICGGRGLTNTKLRFSSDGLDYTSDDTTQNVDMLGFIASLYNDGQYSTHINYAKAWNLIGMVDQSAPYGVADTGKFEEFGDIQYFTALFKSDGIGEGISDYLDDTTIFASYAMSKTNPNDNSTMLGSPDSETGHSYWIGINAPCPLDPEDARIGVEWNKGSKYWRSMTYGEDTMIGSKIAARGTAWEIYRNQKITDSLSSSIRFTKIKYDYTGSNGFFGDLGAPISTSSANAVNAVKEAQNITAYIRYRF